MIDVSAPERPVLWLEGDIDLANADDLIASGIRAIGQAPPGATLVMDLSRVEFADSSALNALVRLRNLAVERGMIAQLRSVPEIVRSLLDVAGLADFFALGPG